MTRHRYAGLATVFALIASTVGVGCARDETPNGALPGLGGDDTTGGNGNADGATTPNTPDTNDGTMNPGPEGGSTAEGDAAMGNGNPGTGDGGMIGGSDPKGSCVPAASVDEDGPFTPTHIENVGPSGASWVFYPEELGQGGMLHPVFNWGPGAGTGPAQYTDHLNRLASHGFVVISQRSSGRGDTEKAALDWLLAEGDKQGSTFYQKLDPNRVGAGGHSLGSLTTMAMASDPRLGLYVLVCGGCMSGRGGCGAADIHGPTVILGGDTDTGTPNYQGDYEEITSPVVFLTKDDTGHIACARNNLSPWVAFMRWQFCGERQWSDKFFDGGEYCTNPWTCKSKNF